MNNNNDDLEPNDDNVEIDVEQDIDEENQNIER